LLNSKLLPGIVSTQGGGVHPVLEAQRLSTFDYIASFCEQDSDES